MISTILPFICQYSEGCIEIEDDIVTKCTNDGLHGQKQSPGGVKKGVLRSFAKFTGKNLRQSLCNFIKKRLAQVFSYDCAKFLRLPFLTEHLPATACMAFIIFFETIMKSVTKKVLFFPYDVTIGDKLDHNENEIFSVAVAVASMDFNLQINISEIILWLKLFSCNVITNLPYQDRHYIIHLYDHKKPSWHTGRRVMTETTKWPHDLN